MSVRRTFATLMTLMALAGSASAAPRRGPQRALGVGPAAWIGVFRPTAPGVEPCACDRRTVIGHAGTIVALTPGSDRPAASGAVRVVQPLVGMNLEATIDHGKVVLPYFAIDRREGADAVLILPATAKVVFLDPTPSDDKLIRAALMRDEVLSGVKRALDKLEIGVVDIDGDHRADFAVTYGCNAWADGQCQSHGEFLLAAVGDHWVEID
jgi:hypothetical protein